ncbi:CNNM domain-containing protein [Stieleria sp. ICT_E10.1]|uniref:CNNM domain-containing protein n=1 Tax=Stieleria sedimenti TaxID=2976331 RepID=UPI00217FAC27|nr:CNNM domain-containing protein [Stieleria sedimenti]MCS7467316.1 CNNM domain-containing protein [Stieleria sedimenti]
MSELLQYVGWLVPMAVLILLSALFSGSEAALFSLTLRQRRQLRRGGVGGRIADRMLRDSEKLLSAILFWNLLINMTYFAIASIVASRLDASVDAGASVALLFTSASLLTIIFFSEMLPKSLALLAPMQASILIAPVLNLAVRLVSPLLPIIKTSNLLAGRLLWPSFQPENEIDLVDIERAVELGTDDAALLERERLALQNLVAIAEMRASELMRPRSRLHLVESPIQADALFARSPPGGYAIITDETGDTMVGALGVRMLRPSQIDHFEDLVEPVIYVPWSARVARVLDLLNENDLSVAIVVDEYGDGIGALSIDRIFRRLLAPEHDQFEEDTDSAAIEQLEPDLYRVAGGIALRQLAKQLAVSVPDESVATVAGFIQRHNERLPRLGDQATLEDYLLTVVEEQEGALRIEVRRQSESDAPHSHDERDFR